MVLYEAAMLSIGNLLVTCISGFIGNRADWLGCKALRHFTDNFLPSQGTPVNHDISKNIIECLKDSTSDFFEKCKKLPFDSQTSTVINQFSQMLIDCDSEKLMKQEVLLGELRNNLDHMIDGGASAEMIDGGAVVSVVVTSVEHWIASNISETIPVELKAVFRSGYDQDGLVIPPWESLYRVRIAEKIKTNERFRSILTSESMSKILMSLKSVEETLERIAQSVGPTRWDDFILSRGKPDLGVAPTEPQSLQHSRIRSAKDIILKVGQEYNLQAKGLKNGTMLLLERYDGKWQFLPLECKADNTIAMTIENMSVNTTLPLGSSYSSEHIGKHKLALLVFSNGLTQAIKRALQSHEEYISLETQKTIIEFLHAQDLIVLTADFIIEN